MTVGPPARPLTDELAALLRGTCAAWRALGVTPAELFATCADHGLVGLVDHQLRRGFEACDWPAQARDALTEYARAEAAKELLRQREIVSVLDALANNSIHPILLKGTPLAYSIYPAPQLRPRSDTDLLVPRSAVEAVRRILAAGGYSAPVYCDGELVFCQFELGKTDEYGIRHAFDFHWKVSMQSVFADLLTYDELAAGAAPVAALGPHARAAGPLHALLLACVHPAMHHQNVERLLWTYDTHLLASRLSAAEWERFVALALSKQVGAIAAYELDLARSRFGTDISARMIERLGSARATEPSSAYLRPGRRWHHELWSRLQGISRWNDRARLLREVVFPGPAYMLRAYGVPSGLLGMLSLPTLYLHRGVRGLMKVVAGQK